MSRGPIGLISILLLTFSVQIGAQTASFRLRLRQLLAHSVPEIEVPDLVLKQDRYVLLDAREPREFEISHLTGAISVGYDSFDLSKLQSIPLDAPLVVYCSVGYRSEKVAEKLIKAGYKNVQNLYGGIFEWVNQGGEVYNKNGSTDAVHAFSRTWGIWLKRGRKVYR
jgi:rhodanese-related sulfurtransferase